MDRTTGFRLFLLAGCAVLPASPAMADETQYWFTESASLPIAPDWSGQVTVAQRVKSGPDQFVFRAGVDRKVTGWLRLGGGIVRSRSSVFSEWRPNQDATISTGPLSLRLRLEERFISGAPRTAFRFRPRIQLSVPVGLATRAQVSGEVTYSVRSASPGGSGEIEGYRLAAGLTRKLAPSLEGGLAYTYIVSPRPGPDRKVHAPGVTVGLRF